MAVSGVEQGKTPESLVTPAFTGFIPIAESGTKAALTTGMTTDRKNFIFTVRRGIMTEIEYPGIAKLVSRLVWDQETVRSSRTTRTKTPLKSTISEGVFLFFDSASATERTRDLCGSFLLHIAKYAANRCIYSTNLSIPFCAAPL